MRRFALRLMPTLRPRSRVALSLSFLLVAACGAASHAQGRDRGADGRENASSDDGKTSFPTPPPLPPAADVRTVASSVDDAPLVVARNEPLGTLRVNARVQLARGTDGTWAVLGSDGASAAPIFWAAPGADAFRVARGQEGTLLGGELSLLTRAATDASTPTTSPSDRLRILGPSGWGPPRAITPEQAEAARADGQKTVDLRGAFTLASGDVRHTFRREPNALIWSVAGQERTLCACGSVEYADVDPVDGAPTLVVREGYGASIYRFADGHWSRVELAPPTSPSPERSQCEVQIERNEPDTALPTSCSFLTHEVPELHAVRLPGSAGLHVLWVETVRDAQLQCRRQRHACDPSGPESHCGASESWSCGQALRSSTMSAAQASVTGGAVRVAALDGLVSASDDAVSLALLADDETAHVAITSGSHQIGSFPVRHLELGPKGTKMRAARPVKEVPLVGSPFDSEDSLLAFGFSGYGSGGFDGGILSLHGSGYRGAPAPNPNFQLDVDARFDAKGGHGIEIGGQHDSVKLLVDATHASLDQHIARTESLGPLEQNYGLGSRNFDGSARHKYTFAVAGERVTVSIDGTVLGTGDLRGGAASIRFGCVDNCDSTVASTWSALTVTRR